MAVTNLFCNVFNFCTAMLHVSSMIPKFCHITPYLQDLHWLPVQARIQFKLLTIVFKCIHGNGPQYLSELLCRKMTRPGLRSANSLILCIPRTLSRAEQSTADRSFSISGPKLWNQLPVSIQNSCSLDDFKSRLKTFLFKKFFLTPFNFISNCVNSVFEFLDMGTLKTLLLLSLFHSCPASVSFSF